MKFLIRENLIKMNHCDYNQLSPFSWRGVVASAKIVVNERGEVKRKAKHLTFLFLFLQYFLSAQNLIPNPGFEQHDEFKVFEWMQPAIPYYHFQYTYDSLSVPHGGTCLNGICLRDNDENEYLQIELKE